MDKPVYGSLVGRLDNVFDTEFAADLAAWHAIAASLASRIAGMSGADAVDALPQVLAGTRQGELVTCLLIERAERSGEFARDGAATINAYVRGAANETAPWASKRIGLGRALVDRLPETQAAWGRGDLGLEHAFAISQATKGIDDLGLLAELDLILAGSTPELSPADLRMLGQQICDQHLPDEAAKKDADAYARQALSIVQLPDGTWVLRGVLDAEAGTIVNHVVNEFTPKPSTAEILADPAGSMSPAQRRAQALVDICRQALEHDQGCNTTGGRGGRGGGRGTLIVGLPLKDLQSGQGVGRVAGGRTLSAAVLRRWACDSGLIPAVLGTDSEILDFGRKTRTFSVGMRNFVVARDGGCVFPECDRPPSWCQIHHRIHWCDHGETSKENSHLLCEAHHHLLHEGGWTLTVGNDPDRTAGFHPPGGRAPLKGQRRPLFAASKGAIPGPRATRSHTEARLRQ